MDVRKVADRLVSEDGQVWTYLLKILVVFLVLGILITQFGPIIWNQISIRFTAKDASDRAVSTYNNSRRDMDKVYEEVEEFLNDREARLNGNITLVYDQSGHPVAISVPVRKIVNTFLFEKVGYLAPYTEAQSTQETSINIE
ncbi:MAG: hypothetical protein ACOC78_01100 [Actinomycetota bacterium]